MSFKGFIEAAIAQKCHICGGSGHIIKECPTKARIDGWVGKDKIRAWLWGRARSDTYIAKRKAYESRHDDLIENDFREIQRKKKKVN